MARVDGPPPLAWWRVQRSALQAKMDGRLTDATAIVTNYLESGHLEPLVEAEALGFRSLLLEDVGQPEKARGDVERALLIAPAPSYVRYTLQLTMGSLEEKLGRRAESVSAYLAALQTATEDGGISVGTALQRLLAVAQLHELTQSQRQVISQGVSSSWRLLGIAGSPVTENLQEAAEILVREQTRAR